MNKGNDGGAGKNTGQKARLVEVSRRWQRWQGGDGNGGDDDGDSDEGSVRW